MDLTNVKDKNLKRNLKKKKRLLSKEQNLHWQHLNKTREAL